MAVCGRPFDDDALFVGRHAAAVGAALRMVRTADFEVQPLDAQLRLLAAREEVARSRRPARAQRRPAVRRAAQIRWHGRLIRALRPYGDDRTSVGDAMRRAAADLGIDAAGRAFEAALLLAARID